MAYGLPVIGSDFGHMKDYIDKDQCGIAVAPTDTRSIADAVISILSDQKLYLKYSENGKRASREKYRWELEFKKLVGHYNHALNGR